MGVTVSDIPWNIMGKRNSGRSPRGNPNFPPRPTGDADAERFYDNIVSFMLGPDQTMTFSSNLSGLQRKKIHSIANQFVVSHHSVGSRGQRAVTLVKVTPEQLKVQREQEAIFRTIIKKFQESARLTQLAFRDPRSIPVVLDRTGLENDLRYCSWNIEWMDYFYESDTEFKKTNPSNGISDVHELCSRIGCAIKEISPDVLAILEGPVSLARMELFVTKYLESKYTCFGGIDGGSQRIYVLVRKDSIIKNAALYRKADDYLSQPWYFDLQGNLELKEYHFIRRPIVVRGEVQINDEMVPIYFAAVHAKSKYVHGGRRMWEGAPEEKNKFIVKSVQNRRKIGSECGRLRKCLEATAHADQERPLIIVSGDMNDGPGMDFFEEYYLLFDSVNVLMGNTFQKEAMLYPVLNQPEFVSPTDQYSCIFDDYVDKIKDKKVMLDHIFVSGSLRPVTIQAAFAHELWEKYSLSHNGYTDRQNYLSDHRPVFADFAISALVPGYSFCF